MEIFTHFRDAPGIRLVRRSWWLETKALQSPVSKMFHLALFIKNRFNNLTSPNPRLGIPVSPTTPLRFSLFTKESLLITKIINAADMSNSMIMLNNTMDMTIILLLGNSCKIIRYIMTVMKLIKEPL